ncbi:ester cyclase [Micromonospora sediminicola]|uniref:ester cyclase n=1 Tax=Micromonospora sediminicola TaxID=946078 RepID=UPI00378A1B26
MNTAESLARGVLDALNSGEIDKIGPLVAEDFVDHGAPPGAPQGRAGYVQIMTFVTQTLRIRYELHDIISVGDKVAIRATAHGVHDTEQYGVPPTGKPYTMPTMHMYREKDGLLQEHWGVRDELSVLRQFGIAPSPLPPGETPS